MPGTESKFVVKVYIVQKADRCGNLHGEVLAAKLTRSAAHEIAKNNAPAKVTCIVADKSPVPNGPDYVSDQKNCN